MSTNSNYCGKRICVIRVILFVALAIPGMAACARPAQTEDFGPRAVVLDPAAININVATAAEIERVPSIGGVLAARIVEFRESYGRFRRPEHLMLVQGIGDARFRKIRRYIKTE